MRPSRLSNFLFWVSLVLCVATLLVWWRGGRATDGIYYRNGGPLVTVDARRGEISLVVQRHHRWALQGLRYRRSDPLGYSVREQLRWPPDRRRWQLAGFALWTSEEAGQWVATVPYWSIAAAAITWPGLLLTRHCRRVRRAKAGLCPACGYDLRATPLRWPECGRRQAAGVE